MLALVLEGAALLSGGLYLVSILFGWIGMARAGAFGFFAFTAAALVAVVVLLISGNTRRQRTIRQQAQQPDAA